MKRYLGLFLALVFVASLLPVSAENAKVLTYWTVSGDLGLEHQREVIGKFERENNVRVEINNSFSGWPDFWTKLMTSIAGGTAPDIIRIKETHTADLALKGALLDITDYVAEDPTTNPEDFMDAMWRTVVFDDKVFALPNLGNIIVLFYNVDLFQKAGYTEPPKNWDELREYAIKLTDLSKGEYGFMWYELGVREPVFAWWYGFYLMAGGEYWANGEVGKRISLNNEAGRRALQLQMDMLYNDKSAVPPAVAVSSLAENGKVAMWMQGSWNLGAYPKTAPNLNWKVAFLPGDHNNAHNALVDNLAITASTKEPDLAYKLLSLLSGEECDYLTNSSIGQLPCRKANLAKEPYSTDPNYKVCVDAFMLPETMPKPLSKGYEEIGVALATELQKAWFNQISVDECLVNAEKIANDILDRVNSN